MDLTRAYLTAHLSICIKDFVTIFFISLTIFFYKKVDMIRGVQKIEELKKSFQTNRANTKILVWF